MRTWAALGILTAAAAGCVLDVALPDAPTVVHHADCSAKPGVLAHIAGLQASSMLIDEVNLYVVAAPVDPSKLEVWQIPKRSAPPRRLATDLPPIAGMALSGSSVVLTTSGDAGSANGEVLALPLDGVGSPVHLAANRRVPSAVIAGENGVYWAEEGVDPSGQLSGAIMRLSRSDDAGVATFQRMEAGEMPRQFRILAWDTSAWLYWTTGDPAHPTSARGQVHGCALATPLSPVIRIDDPDGGGAGSIVVMSYATADGDHDQIVYAGPHGITAVTVEQDGGIGAARDFFPTGGFVGRLAEGLPYDVDYVDPSMGALTSRSTLRAGDAGGTAAHRLATGVDPATALKADDGCVYWIDARAGEVMMVQ
jgi:hypothetical protein